MSSLFSASERQISLGLRYFLQGWAMLFQRQFLPFVILPVVINTLLMLGLIWLFFTNIGTLLEAFLPSYLEWLSVILIPLIFVMILLMFYFAFTTLANFIAAPFNALLAEKAEQYLTGERISSDAGMGAMFKDLPRMLKREWTKILYSLPRLFLLFLLGFIPLLGQTLIPLFVLIFSAWLLAIQYCDYPFDNHKIGFTQMREALAQRRLMNGTFGALVSLFTAVPFLNLVVMPVAVCGATAMWVNEYRRDFVNNSAEKGREVIVQST